MSSKRAELQSSFSGKAPNKVKGGGLRGRLCQDGFHYGGMSSPACAASLWAISLCCFTQKPVESPFNVNSSIARLPVYLSSVFWYFALWFLPWIIFSNSSAFCRAASRANKPVQKTLDKLFVKGSAQLIAQARRLGGEHPYAHKTPTFLKAKVGNEIVILWPLVSVCCFAAMQSGEVSGCSNEFKSLMSMPTPGALQLKQHLTQCSQTGIQTLPFFSITVAWSWHCSSSMS